MSRKINLGAYRLPLGQRRLSGLLHTDFCPELNRYVYWLKEPIGWFILAAAASMLVGVALNPIGLQLAAAIAILIALGLIFPWIAVRTVVCRIEPSGDRLCEHESCRLSLTIRNRLPIPLWGLMVEDYLSVPPTSIESIVDPDARRRGDVGLAEIAPLSETTFHLSLKPEFRGHYPQVMPRLACAFPFGLWTARQPIRDLQPVIVWPKRPDLAQSWDAGGMRSVDAGCGNRPAAAGDFAGVRPFRRGDSLRSIHWVQSARTDSIVVCEKHGPQQQFVTLELNCRPISAAYATARDHLAWRVRIAAALGEHLLRRHIGICLDISGERTEHSAPRGIIELLDRLAAVPLDGVPHNHTTAEGCEETQRRARRDTDQHRCRSHAAPRSDFGFIIEPVSEKDRVAPESSAYLIRLTCTGASGVRSARHHSAETDSRSRTEPLGYDALNATRSRLIDLRDDISSELQALLREVEHGRCAA